MKVEVMIAMVIAPLLVIWVVVNWCNVRRGDAIT